MPLSSTKSGAAAIVLASVVAIAVWWTWPGGGLEGYQGEIEIAEVQNNRTDRVQISILAIQPEGVRDAEEDIVVDAIRPVLDPGEARGSTLLSCTGSGHIASTLKVVVRSNQTGDEDMSLVPLDPEDCQPGGGTSFSVKALDGAVGIGEAR